MPDQKQLGKTHLVRLSGSETIHFSKIVRMTDKELDNLKRLFNSGKDNLINEEIDGWFDKISDVVDGDGLENGEAEVIESKDGGYKSLETLSCDKNYPVPELED